MSLKTLADKLCPVVMKNFHSDSADSCKLFLSASNMATRAIVRNAVANSPAEAWNIALEDLSNALKAEKITPTILRADWVISSEKMTWANFISLLGKTRRNYFRKGLALDAGYKIAFTEQEMNANSMLYKDGKDGSGRCVFRKDRSDGYCQKRFGCDFPALEDSAPVEIFEADGTFLQEGDEIHLCTGRGIYSTRRDASPIDPEIFMRLAKNGANYLARQVQKNGRFIYGYYPCFDKIVPSYNTVRHFSSVSSMLDVYRAYTKMPPMKLGKAITTAMDYGVKTFIRYRKLDDGTEAAYPEDITEKEIKLGALGIALVSLANYTELMHTKKYIPLMNAIARGIKTLQKDDGSFIHVLNSTDFSVKEDFRIVYYDGEALFGLMRLYAITKDEELLKMSVKAFDRFVITNHWQNHDHWLSYAVNEFTRWQPDKKYFEFGINNFLAFLPFIYHRDTQYPTLLELMMAADKMLENMKTRPEMADLLAKVNFDDFYAAMESRAKNLLNGYFWPELAMYYANPQKIVGSFFIRHQATRVRIDDVQHFLSGFVAYCKYLERRKNMPDPKPSPELLNGKAEGTGVFNIKSSDTNAGVKKSASPVNANVTDFETNLTTAKFETVAENKTRDADTTVIFYGGDVNLGRRMNFRSREVEPFLRLNEMPEADLRVVNLECIIATKGEQGINKGEGGPYYFRARPEQTNILTKAGVDVVFTANNHAGDYGSEALLEQKKYLDAAGILYAGSGENFDAAIKPIYKKVRDLTLAIFSVDSTMKPFASSADKPGTAFIPSNKPELWKNIFKDKLREAHEKADVVIVAPHWGINNVTKPSDDLKKIGRLLIDLGADVVLGCHSHFVHGVENYKERPIIYDAGDFLFDSLSKPKTGGCFTLEISASGVKKVNFIPLVIGYGQTAKARPDRAAKINEDFIALCKEFKTACAVTSDSKVAINFNPPPRESKVIDNPAAVGVLERHLIEPMNEPRPEWTVDKVPEDAIIPPKYFGALKLVGWRIPPECQIMTERKMLYVETYWTITEPVAGDCRLSIVGAPVRECSMPAYGKGMDHEFCDYMFPVNRWKVGVIYREKFGLRPAETRQLANVNLRVEMNVTIDGNIVGTFTDPKLIEMRLPFTPYYKTDFDEIIYKSEPGKCWTAEQLAKVTGGTWIVPPPKDFYIQSLLRIDDVNKPERLSRLQKPIMFFACSYNQHAFHAQGTPNAASWDGHDRISANINKFNAALISHDVKDLPPDFPLLKVKDPVRAMIELGFASRKRFQGKVIAVTGSNGKTTTCAMLEQVLGKDHKITATSDSMNTRVMVPFVFTRVKQDDAFAIIEMAVSAFTGPRGAITYDVNPDVAVVTSLSPAHILLYKSLEGIARYKSRILCGMSPGGYAIFNRDMPCYEIFEQKAKSLKLNIVTFGTHPESTIRMNNLVDGGEFFIGDKIYNLHCHVPSEQIYDALAVIGVAIVSGLPIETALEYLKSFEPVRGRGNIIKANHGGKNLTLIDSSYNANPSSMKTALDYLKTFESNQKSRVAILGDIAELGDESIEQHKNLAEPVLAAAPDRVLLCGEFMRHTYELIKDKLDCLWYASVGNLIQDIDSQLKDGDTILVKSSHSTHLDKVIEYLS